MTDETVNSLLQSTYESGKAQGRKEERERVIKLLTEKRTPMVRWISFLCPPTALMDDQFNCIAPEVKCRDCTRRALEKLLGEADQCPEDASQK
jgi:hypothetical protein